MHTASVRHRFGRGFTVIELILVLAIMLLLTSMAVASMSRLLRTSRIDQATQTVLSVLMRARASAQRERATVSVFFGDDPVKLKPSPMAGVLPKNGEIEIWTVRDVSNGSAVENMTVPYEPGNPYSASWGGTAGYPFWVKIAPLSTEPLTLPDGIRIFAGVYTTNYQNQPGYWDAQGLPPQRAFGFENLSRGPIGQIKTHQIVYDKSGRIAGFMNNNSFAYLLVLDTTTGEHRIVHTGDYTYGSTRPYVVNYGSLNTSGKQPIFLNAAGPSSSYMIPVTPATMLKSFKDIEPKLDAIPGTAGTF